jgi:hypothetical protein
MERVSVELFVELKAASIKPTIGTVSLNSYGLGPKENDATSREKKNLEG